MKDIMDILVDRDNVDELTEHIFKKCAKGGAMIIAVCGGRYEDGPGTGLKEIPPVHAHFVNLGEAFNNKINDVATSAQVACQQVKIDDFCFDLTGLSTYIFSIEDAQNYHGVLAVSFFTTDDIADTRIIKHVGHYITRNLLQDEDCEKTVTGFYQVYGGTIGSPVYYAMYNQKEVSERIAKAKSH